MILRFGNHNVQSGIDVCQNDAVAILDQFLCLSPFVLFGCLSLITTSKSGSRRRMSYQFLNLSLNAMPRMLVDVFNILRRLLRNAVSYSCIAQGGVDRLCMSLAFKQLLLRQNSLNQLHRFPIVLNMEPYVHPDLATDVEGSFYRGMRSICETQFCAAFLLSLVNSQEIGHGTSLSV